MKGFNGGKRDNGLAHRYRNECLVAPPEEWKK